jgi:hypothetical protein
MSPRTGVTVSRAAALHMHMARLQRATLLAAAVAATLVTGCSKSTPKSSEQSDTGNVADSSPRAIAPRDRSAAGGLEHSTLEVSRGFSGASGYGHWRGGSRLVSNGAIRIREESLFLRTARLRKRDRFRVWCDRGRAATRPLDTEGPAAHQRSICLRGQGIRGHSSITLSSRARAQGTGINSPGVRA